ncbi:MAG: hypothetical protein QXG39_04840 [Candidatus Aenigmatarchaeota archaeon]
MKKIRDNYELFDCEIAKFICRQNRIKRKFGFSEIKECPFKKFCERKDKEEYIYCSK